MESSTGARRRSSRARPPTPRRRETAGPPSPTPRPRHACSPREPPRHRAEAWDHSPRGAPPFLARTAGAPPSPARTRVLRTSRPSPSRGAGAHLRRAAGGRHPASPRAAAQGIAPARLAASAPGSVSRHPAAGEARTAPQAPGLRGSSCLPPTPPARRAVAPSGRDRPTSPRTRSRPAEPGRKSATVRRPPSWACPPWSAASAASYAPNSSSRPSSGFRTPGDAATVRSPDGTLSGWRPVVRAPASRAIRAPAATSHGWRPRS